MTKNKLIWNIVMFLIAIFSLPIAYAQTTTGSWLFVIINALIIGVILFILQAFLIPKKEPKEQTAVWVAVIVGSLLIAWLYGRSGLIWQTGPFARFFSITVIVNTLIIAIVAYFALGLLPIAKNITSPEGQTGKGILIFLGSLVWAIGIQNSYGSIFIWQAYSYFISYFIGPEGILNPYPPQYRLLVFTGSAVLLGFFFENFLIKGGNKTVNYALAVILAMNMASSGVSVRSVIILGEIIFTITLERALEASIKTGRLRWIFAGGLVGWASAAMTYGTQYQGFLATLLGPLVSTFIGGKATGWGWWGKTGGLVLAIILVIGIILFAMNRGMLKEGAKRVWKEALDKLRTIRGVGKFLTDTASIRNPVLENELPLELKDMRYEIYVLMNFMLRHDIFKAKAKSTADFRDAIIETEKIFAGNSPTPDDIHRSMKSWIEGSEIIYDNHEWKWKGGYGWGRNYIIICKIMNRLQDMLSRDLTLPPDERKITEAMNTFRTQFNAHVTEMDTAYGKYSSAVRRYKAVNKIRAFRLRFLDMYNFFGKINRGYFFAKLHAKPDYYTYEINKESDNKLHRSINWKKCKKHHSESVEVTNYEEGSKEYLLELNLFGYCISDINAIEIERRDLPYIRRFKYEDMVFLPKPTTDWEIKDDPRLSDEEKNRLLKDAKQGVVFSDVLSLSVTEWDFFIKDMMKGSFHPFSKTTTDYIQLLKDVVIDLNKAGFKGLLDQDKDIAFDREALKNPGLFVYWGRKRFFDLTQSSLKVFPANPYPMASIEGIWQFVNKYATRLAGNLQETEMYLDNYFKMDYQDLGKVGEGEKK